MLPLIGITADNKDNTAASGTYECASRYCRAVAAAGGLPVVLPHEVALVPAYVERCAGFVFTGGVDPDVRMFGQPLHPQARVMDPGRQAFEAALLEEIERANPQAGVLGVCLGMQMMALHAGAVLDQYLPDSIGVDKTTAHQKNNRHAVVVREHASVIGGGAGTVVSSHRQAVASPGRLRVVATAPDGVIEAVDDPARPFYVGVQWHPERNEDPASVSLNERLFQALVAAARSPT